MAENIVVNGVQYNDVDSMEMKTPDGRSVGFYPDAVRYNAQELTSAQKAQVINNLGLSAITITGVDANGTTHTWTVYGGET